MVSLSQSMGALGVPVAIKTVTGVTSGTLAWVGTRIFTGKKEKEKKEKEKKEKEKK